MQHTSPSETAEEMSNYELLSLEMPDEERPELSFTSEFFFHLC